MVSMWLRFLLGPSIANARLVLLVDSDTLNVSVDLHGGNAFLTVDQATGRVQRANAVKYPAESASQHR